MQIICTWMAMKPCQNVTDFFIAFTNVLISHLLAQLFDWCIVLNLGYTFGISWGSLCMCLTPGDCDAMDLELSIVKSPWGGGVPVCHRGWELPLWTAGSFTWRIQLLLTLCQHLGQCLASSECSINDCWINKSLKTWLLVFCLQDSTTRRLHE